MSTAKDLTDQRFGRLVAIERAGKKDSHALWKCKCDCGNEKVISSRSLIRGGTRSCGCLQVEGAKERFTTHGMVGTRIFKIWSGMKGRCKDSHSKYYGGRNITVCNEWFEFIPFYKWAINNGYSDGLTIDRIDNNRNYEASNCKWSTKKEQQNNTRYNVWLEYNDQRKTLAQWSKICGIPYKTLQARIGRRGWSVEKALFTPVIIRKYSV